MSVTLEQQSADHWRLSGELSFQTVPGLEDRVAALLADRSRVEVDLGGVERADSAGVALLVEWAGEARRRAVAIRYLNVPSQMLAIARVSSLDQVLPLALARACAMGAAVEIQDVHKHYGELQALAGVSFRIEPGEFFGLLGPNGAGKSTLINIIAGLAKATRGRVAVMGYDVVRQYRQSRDALGVVPQELVYDPFFTVREMLHWQSGYFGRGRENHAWIEELLQTLDLSQKADANLQNLSGGMKRRVLIAQALVHRPEVVVLDEPTAGVDVELRQALWRFTRRLHQQGHTIVLTTHYLEEAEALCERIAILHRGTVRALDSKRALLARHPYRFLTLELADPAAALPEALAAMVVESEPGRVCLRMHKDTDQIGAVLETLGAAGIRLRDLSTHEPGLEDIFLELTAGGAQTP